MKVNDMDIEIIGSKRKTISLEITRDLRILMRSPLRISDIVLEKFAQDKALWIQKHMADIKNQIKISESQNDTIPKFTAEDINRLTAKAQGVIPERTANFAKIVGVSYNKITVRSQISRWGSCSGKGNLSFNCLLMLVPADVLDYVIVHELCHLKQMNHSKNFWAEVAKVLPQYNLPKKWLKAQGNLLIQRLR